MKGAMRMALIRNYSDGAESRRRRDRRGRYMERGYGARDEYGEMEDNYGARDEYDLYVFPQDRRMGFGEYQPPYGNDMNDNDVRRRNTGREDGEFSEQGEQERYPMSRYNPQRGASMHHGHQGKIRYMQGGMKQHGMPRGYIPPLTREKAEHWVRSMDGENEKGETWSFEEIEKLAEKHGIPKQEKKIVEFYAVMNMLASDYYKVAEKFDVLDDEFFVCMAKAFIEDKDAVPDKVAMYYECIANKDE